MKQIEIRFKGRWLFNRPVDSKEQAKELTEEFIRGSMYEGDLQFIYAEIDSDLNTTLEENLSHWHTRYTKIYHEIIGKYEA